MAARRKISPGEVAGWAALAVGALVGIPWLMRLRPTEDPPGAETGTCPGLHTLDNDQARAIADAIHAAVADLTEDEAEVTRQLQLAQTDADVCRIIKAYGRRSVGFGVGPYNLPQVVSRYLTERVSLWLSETWIDRINADYSAKGITYRF